MSKPLLHSAAWLSGLLLGSLASPALSDDPYSSAQLEVMAGGCASCHGTDGRLAGNVPAIAGRSAESLEASLLAFKRDEVDNTTVMNRIVKGYSDEELAALARHFADIDTE